MDNITTIALTDSSGVVTTFTVVPAVAPTPVAEATPEAVVETPTVEPVIPTV